MRPLAPARASFASSESKIPFASRSAAEAIARLCETPGAAAVVRTASATNSGALGRTKPPLTPLGATITPYSSVDKRLGRRSFNETPVATMTR
jgi:hypothetical protein